jgi:peroxiredoxin
MKKASLCFLPLLALACGLSACGEVANRPALTESSRVPAPEFTLPDAYGTPFALSDYRGKVVLLNFWAPWCFSCQSEMSAFEDLRNYFPRDKFEVLAVTVLEGRDRETGEKHGYPVLLDVDKAVAERYQVGILPVTLIIDKEGRVAPFPDPDTGKPETVFQGPRGWSSLKVVRALQKLIDE